MRLASRFSRFVIDHPRLVLVIALLVTAALLPALRGVASMAPEDISDLDPSDPEMARFSAFQRRFGEREMVVVAVRANDVFQPAVLRYLETLSERIERLSEVEATDSLVRVERVRWDESTGIVSEPLLDAIPDEPASLDDLRTEVMSHPLWPGSIVSKDGTLAAIQVALRRASDGHVPRVEATLGILDAIQQGGPPDVETLVGGRGPMMVDSQRSLRDDLRGFLWLTPLVIIASLAYLMRSVAGTVVPLAVAALSVLWTLLLFIATGQKLSLSVAMLPTVVGVLCLSDNIHLVARYRQLVARQRDPRAAITESLEHLVGACFLTSLTTAVGFGSLLVSGVPSLRVFGLWAAIGVGVAYLLSVTVTPAVIAVWPERVPVHARPRRSLVDAAIARLAHRGGGGVKAASAAVALTLLGAVGTSRLQLDTRFTDVLPDDAPSSRARRVLEEKLAGTNLVALVVEGAEWSFEEPDNLRALVQLQQRVESEPEVDRSFSLVDVLGLVGDPSANPTAGRDRVIPSDGREITDLLVGLSHTPMLDPVTDTARSQTCIHIHTKEVGTAALLDLIQRIEAHTRAVLPQGLAFYTTGTAKVLAATSQSLARAQLWSFGLTFLSISLLMMITLRSVRLALIAIVPNAAPIIITLGAMGMLGIPFGASGVMVSCVAFGIAVDDTIHFLARYRATRGPVAARVRRTLAVSGRGMVFTTIVNASGFAVLGLSSLAPSRQFGLLTALALTVALLADLLLLPQLVRWFDREDGSGRGV